jgi:glucose/arabinose dehydrogenase
MRTSTILKRSSIPMALLLSLSVLPASSAAVPGSPPSPPAPPSPVSAPAEDDRPGDRHWIDPDDLPDPVNEGDPEAPDFNNPPTVVDRPAGVMPHVPEGFEVEEFASGLDTPRVMRLAPNGDVFLSESGAGRVLVFAADADGGLSAEPTVFAEELDRPFGIAFYPHQDPEWVYVAAADQVVRYPYSEGDRKAAGPAEVIIADIPTERHWTRDLAVAPDGEHLFVSIGSASNVAGAMPEKTPEEIQAWEDEHGRGAAWGAEEDRAVVRVFDPEGQDVRNYATGLRNCSGVTIQPETDQLWCTGNERDHLGADLVPDFLTTVQDEGFYGWPWFYTGGYEDPAHADERPDLQDEVITPDVLIQAHSSTLQMLFYDADAFPDEYHGDAFATLRGSWNREVRTGYKVVRAVMEGGEATGEYVDFMTGFALDAERVYGRPTGITATEDGALLVSEDANGTIYRVNAGTQDCDHDGHGKDHH